LGEATSGKGFLSIDQECNLALQGLFGFQYGGGQEKTLADSRSGDRKSTANNGDFKKKSDNKR